MAVTEPDATRNWPRLLTAWRANLLGSSSKGNEYFLKQLLGTTGNVRAEPTSPELRPRSVWFRSIFILQPDGEAMAEAPLSYQIHAIIALGLFGALALHPTGARVQRAGRLPVPALHRLPVPRGRPTGGADRIPSQAPRLVVRSSLNRAS